MMLKPKGVKESGSFCHTNKKRKEKAEHLQEYVFHFHKNTNNIQLSGAMIVSKIILLALSTIVVSREAR